MSQIISSINENGNYYTNEELRLFTETACRQIPLNSINKFLETHNYDNFLLKELIRDISQGESSFYNITETAKEYHKELYDVMFVKTLEELPLMINSDFSLKPIVSWRFQIGK